jgi:hypothetical protein
MRRALPVHCADMIEFKKIGAGARVYGFRVVTCDSYIGYTSRFGRTAGKCSPERNAAAGAAACDNYIGCNYIGCSSRLGRTSGKGSPEGNYLDQRHYQRELRKEAGKRQR